MLPIRLLFPPRKWKVMPPFRQVMLSLATSTVCLPRLVVQCGVVGASSALRQEGEIHTYQHHLLADMSLRALSVITCWQYTFFFLKCNFADFVWNSATKKCDAPSLKGNNGSNCATSSGVNSGSVPHFHHTISKRASKSQHTKWPIVFEGHLFCQQASLQRLHCQIKMQIQWWSHGLKWVVVERLCILSLERLNSIFKKVTYSYYHNLTH